jgi:hypothetical protein
MFGSKSYYTNPDWVLDGHAPSDYKDIVYGSANYGSTAPYRDVVYRRGFGRPRSYGFFMTQNPAQHSGARRAGMIRGYGAPSGAGKIPCLSTGATDAQVAKDYPELGNWVSTVQQALYNEFTDSPILLQTPNGSFDSKFKEDVEAYQKMVGFSKSDQDGIVGPMTYKKLFGTSDRYLSCSSSGGRQSSSGSSGSSGSPPSTIGGGAPWYMQEWVWYTAGGLLILGSIATVVKMGKK